MMDLKRGQRDTVEKLCGSLEFEVELYHKAGMVIDCTCFGLNAAGKLSDDRYFIFYNQKESPEGGVKLVESAASGTVSFHLSLQRLPPEIAKLSFTAAIDGTKTMRDLTKGYARVVKDGLEAARFSYDGTEFAGERAIVVCELYKKDNVWRFAAVGRGFNGGLKALIESFGGMVQTPAPGAGRAPAPGAPLPSPPGTVPLAPGVSARLPAGLLGGAGAPPAGQASPAALPAKVTARMEELARLCRGETEYLKPLYQSMFTELAFLPAAASHPIKVVMCADASGSMYDFYRNGRVQRAIDKFFAFATTLSESCSMDLWAFGQKSRQFSPVTMDNVRTYSFDEAGGFDRWMSVLNYQYNNEPEVMRDIMMMYGGLKTPTHVLFLTDGRLNSDWEIEEILIKTSRVPIFWQFIGVHGEEYGVLEHLDEIDGRHTKNASFVKFDDIDDITDNMLYRLLLKAECDWLNEIKQKKMVEA